jgi:hypothetical protein
MKAVSETTVETAEGKRFSESSEPHQYYEKWFDINGLRFARRCAISGPAFKEKPQSGKRTPYTLADFDAWCERLNRNLIAQISNLA